MGVDLLKKKMGVGLHFERLPTKDQRDVVEALHVLTGAMKQPSWRDVVSSEDHGRLDFCEWCSLRDRLTRLLEPD